MIKKYGFIMTTVDKKKYYTLCSVLNEQIYYALEELSKKQERPKSYLVRQALQDYLEKFN